MAKLVELEDGTIKRMDDEEAQALIDCGRAKLMTREEIREFETTNFRPYRKLYGNIKTQIFDQVAHRGYEEGFVDQDGRTDLNAIVNALAEGYANHDFDLKLKKKQKDQTKKPQTGADYVGDKKHERPEEACSEGGK